MADLHYEWFENHKVCRIWHRDIVIPVKRVRKDGREFTHYMDVQQDYTIDKGYWEYVKDDYSDNWLLYRINNVKHDRRLALRTPTCYAPSAIVFMIGEKEITTNDCRNIEEYRRQQHFERDRISLVVKWSIVYDGKSILELLKDKPKMTFSEIKNVILNEKGTIDASGIIHKA